MIENYDTLLDFLPLPYKKAYEDSVLPSKLIP